MMKRKVSTGRAILLSKYGAQRLKQHLMECEVCDQEISGNIVQHTNTNKGC